MYDFMRKSFQWFYCESIFCSKQVLKCVEALSFQAFINRVYPQSYHWTIFTIWDFLIWKKNFFLIFCKFLEFQIANWMPIAKCCKDLALPISRVSTVDTTKYKQAIYAQVRRNLSTKCFISLEFFRISEWMISFPLINSPLVL